MYTTNNRTVKIARASFEVAPETKTPRKGKAVVCITTGEVFKSAREAAIFYDLDYISVTKCCSGKIKTVGGGRWNKNGKGLKFCYVADLAYRTKDIAEYISELREEARREKRRAAQIEADKEKFMEMLRRHREETEMMMSAMVG